MRKKGHASSTAAVPKAGRLWNGPGTHEVPVELFSMNRDRLIEQILPKTRGKTLIILQGGEELPFYDTDVTYAPFRQESFFMWTFGVIEPGCFGAIDVTTRTSYLFIPRQARNYEIWKGQIQTPEDYSKKYNIQNVQYSDAISSVVKNLAPAVLLTLRGTNTDSNLKSKEAHFDGIDKFHVNNALLYNEMAELRVVKSDYEIGIIKYANDIASEAHRKVMRYAKPGKTEYQCEAEFLHYCYQTGGCRYVPYTPVCASNGNAAYLHYGHAAAPNNKIIEPGDLLLCDMGASYFGYCAGISCTFPVSGKFSPTQKIIYGAVLAASVAVHKALKPGVQWTDMHLLGARTLLGELKKSGLLKGDVEAMVGAGLGSVFQPHGIGNLLGLDIHDVGGLLNSKAREKGFEMLRTTRVLQKRMVMTVEPGCYFNDSILRDALENSSFNRFLNQDAINKFRGIGGVRIADTVVITKTGAINLTKVPRTVTEVEDWIAGKDNDKYNS